MKDINLFEGLHRQTSNIRKEKTRQGMLIALVLAVILTSAGSVTGVMLKESSLRKQIEEIHLDYDEYDEIILLKETINQKEIRVAVYSMLETSKKFYKDTEVLMMLGNQFPKGIVALNCSFDISGMINISGISTDVESVAYMISRLKAQPNVEDVFVSSLTMPDTNTIDNSVDNESNTADITFVLQMSLK